MRILGQEMLRFTTAGSVDDGKSDADRGVCWHDNQSVYGGPAAGSEEESREIAPPAGHVDFFPC